jgi:tetratricopeptide (TPR) repeat protein
MALKATWQVRAANGPVLAMARHRLGQEHEAREALDEAARVLDDAARGMCEGRAGFWPIAWWDWLESQLHVREAREELGLPAPPDDPRCRFLRGRALSYLQRQTEAAVEFDAVLKLGLNDPQVRGAAHHAQAHRHIDRREWDQVQAEFAQAVAAQPDDADEWHSLAAAHQAAGNAAGHRVVCAEMRRRFAKTTDPATADFVVRACVVTPDAAAADPAALVALARVAVPGEHGNARFLGGALYRAGRDEEAVDCFRAAGRVIRLSAWDWLFLAMAHSGLGHEEEARRCLARADAWVREADQPDANDLSGTQPTWNRWFERTEIEVLRREAVTLLGNGRPTPSPAR